MTHQFTAKNLPPAAAAQMLSKTALDELRASFRSDGRVYVRAHTRVGPVSWFKKGDTAKALKKAREAREAARLALIEQKEKGETL